MIKRMNIYDYCLAAAVYEIPPVYSKTFEIAVFSCPEIIDIPVHEC